MVISDFAIKRPIITIVSMLALAIFGIFALMRLQTDEFPMRHRPSSPSVSSTPAPHPMASNARSSIRSKRRFLPSPV